MLGSKVTNDVLMVIMVDILDVKVVNNEVDGDGQYSVMEEVGCDAGGIYLPITRYWTRLL